MSVTWQMFQNTGCWVAHSWLYLAVNRVQLTSFVSRPDGNMPR